jgi:hypothetical protein
MKWQLPDHKTYFLIIANSMLLNDQGARRTARHSFPCANAFRSTRPIRAW